MEEKDIIERLCSIPLFATTPKETLRGMLSHEGARQQSARSGERIGEENRHALGILLSGTAEIRSADSERIVILRHLRAGEIFDAASLFLKDAPPVSHVVAVTACSVLFLDTALVRELMTRSPAFLDAYLALLAGRVQFLNQKIRCFTAGKVGRRLACLLAAECEGNEEITVSLTALADTLDVGRASLYRALDELESAGLVRHDGRKLSVVCHERLDEYIKEH